MRSKRAKAVVIVLVLLAGTAGALAYGQMQKRSQQKAVRLTGGDPMLGRKLMRHFGCAGCHTVAGVPGAVGQVGPPLDQVGSRVYLAGVVANTPDNLVRWIVDPKAISPRTAMPRTGIGEADARHVAAYLYSLR